VTVLPVVALSVSWGGPPTPLSARELADRFCALTGDELALIPLPDELDGVVPRVEALVPAEAKTDSAPSALQEKYGEFVIAVYESTVPRERARGRRDRRGIRWEKLLAEVGPRPGPYVGAFKVYGRNVLLRWYPESRRREIDERWERLDAALTRIVTDAARRR
jgi:hypothetical protein